MAAVLLPLVPVALVVGSIEYRYHGHGREVQYGYVNIDGYRGDVRPRKHTGEFRVVVVGGSTVYGQGIAPDSAFPPQLERALRARGRDISVINLGYMNDGAYADGLTLKDYRYLKYDLAVLYEGYNDLFNVPNFYSFRHSSLVFRLTGYFPMFPLVFEEKAKAIRYRGNMNAAYRGDQPVVPIGLPSRAGAAALEFAANLDKRMVAAQKEVERTTSGACGYWTFFCEHVADDVQIAFDGGADVLLTVQPYVPLDGDPQDQSTYAVLHRGQASTTLNYLRGRFPGDARLHIANLGEAVDLRRTEYRLDNLHLNEAGNAVIARELVGPVLRVADERAARLRKAS